MDLILARAIIRDQALTDDDLSALLLEAQHKAINHHFWGTDDIPTLEQKERFLERYEFEICNIAKAINASSARDGLISFSELGVSRQWGETGEVTVAKAVSAIPRKAYVV